MALRKPLDLDTGISGNYWKISKVEYHPKQRVIFWIDLYKDQLAREDGFLPLESRSFEVNKVTIEGCAVTWCYTRLKGMELFEDAVNC